MRYLPRRPTAEIWPPIASMAGKNFSEGCEPASVIERPARRGCNWARMVSTSGSSGTGRTVPHLELAAGNAQTGTHRCQFRPRRRQAAAVAPLAPRTITSMASMRSGWLLK